MPADAQIFKTSSGLIAFALAATIFLFGLSAAFLIGFVTGGAGSAPGLALVFAAASGSMGIFALESFRNLRRSIAVDGEGLWCLNGGSEPTYLAWTNVATVQAKDTQQRLVLEDRTGRTRVRLEYQLNDFGKLRDFVLEHVPASARALASSARVFHRTWINKGILLGAFLMSVALGVGMYLGGGGAKSLLWPSLGVLLLGSITQDPNRVVIAKDGFVIEYPGWKRTIPFDTIMGISLSDVAGGSRPGGSGPGNVWAAVTITTRQGKPIRLYRFREGSIALDDALEAAWRAAGEAA